MEKIFAGFPDGLYQIPWLDRAVWLIVQPWGELVVAKTGAQVLHYQPCGHKPVFWLNSEQTTIALPTVQEKQQFIDDIERYCHSQNTASTDSPLRGGAPLCWPWFGAHSEDPSLPNHGLARTAQWQLVSSELICDDYAATTLCFKPVQCLAAQLDLSFSIKVTNEGLHLELNSKNVSNKVQVITQAIHSYFAVANCHKIKVNGLKGCEFIDKLDNNQLKHQQSELTDFNAIDNIYKHSTGVVIIDEVFNRNIVLTKKNSHSTVVWNPADSASSIGINSDYRQFVCVEAANTVIDEIFLQPLQSFSMQQKIVVKHRDDKGLN